jgi:hypothetical protein
MQNNIKQNLKMAKNIIDDQTQQREPTSRPCQMLTTHLGLGCSSGPGFVDGLGMPAAEDGVFG